MEAVIKIKPSELTEEFYGKLKSLVENAVLLTIRIDSTPNLEIELNNRLSQLEEGKVRVFTMEELDAFVSSK
jgi:hypothetical protein